MRFCVPLQVYKAEWNDYQQVAVKQLKQHDARNDIRFLREIAILKECRSTNVVQFLVRPVLPGKKHKCNSMNMWGGRSRSAINFCSPCTGALLDSLVFTEYCINCRFIKHRSPHQWGRMRLY